MDQDETSQMGHAHKLPEQLTECMFGPGRSAVGLRLCVSSKLPGDAAAAGPLGTGEKPWSQEYPSRAIQFFSIFNSNIFKYQLFLFCFFCCPFFFFSLFRAASMAYGGSQARGGIGAVAASLHHSHSNAGSKPHLRPTSQLRAMPDP